MAVSPNVKVLGPFSPRDFTSTSDLTTAMTAAAAALAGTTVIAMDPVEILGNIYLIATTV